MATYNDIYCLEDIDPYFSAVGGRQSLGQASVRRITCPRGSNPADPLNYGMDVRNWINKNFTKQEIFNLETSVEEEIGKDSRVLQVTAAIKWFGNGSFGLIIKIVSTEDDVFTIDLAVRAPESTSVDSSASNSEAEVAVQVNNVDQTSVTVTDESQLFLAKNLLRKGLIVQNTSKVVDIHYAFGKAATVASLVIPANSQREFDPVPTGSLNMLAAGKGNTVTAKIEESY